MREKSQAIYPEVFVSTVETTRAVSRAAAQGRLRKLASRLYTTNLTDAPEDIVRRHIWSIVAGYFPGALVADRTALELLPATDTSVCVIADSNREQIIPGLIIRPRIGIGPLPQDRPFLTDGLYLSASARAYLENMRTSRMRRGRVPRTLGAGEIEKRLETLISRTGAMEVNRLRDEIALLAPQLGLGNEAAGLTGMIGAMLGTREAVLNTATGMARQSGLPYDSRRLETFQKLHTALRAYAPRTRLKPPRTQTQDTVLAFFEAYFSNFIEGTEFAIEEAEEIIFHGRIPKNRPRDAHDILGTYRLAIDSGDWRPAQASASEFIQRLKAYNATIMQARPEMEPGTFKSRANQAGASLFVAPELVGGTLRQGYALLRSLETPFHRAVFTMFLVAEVHPFTDGNGRTARIVMNDELSAAGEERIIIPTVYRDNYVSALKALTHNGNPDPLIRAMDFAWRWTAAIDWTSIKETTGQLRSCNAFAEDDSNVRLKLPTAEDIV